MLILRLVPFRSCWILDEQPQDILVQGCIHLSILPPFFHVATKTQKASPSFQHRAYQSLNLAYLSYFVVSPLHMLNKCAKGMPYWEDSTVTEKGEGKCCGRALKAAGGVEIVSVVRICAPKK